MGMFSTFLMNGFKAQDVKFYSPGQLFEVMSMLGEQVKGEDMRRKVMTLLNGWEIPADTFRAQGQKVPAYALEIHAVMDKSYAYNGYGTYVFVPDERRRMVTVPLKSIFSAPTELEDDEDPVKILASLYADESGWSTNDPMTIMELSCTSDEFYPLNTWSKELSNDPLEEIFGIFDAMGPGQYAGISIVIIPPELDWEQRAKMRIRYIEDPEYEEEIGVIETFRRVIHGDELPDEEAERLAGYQKQQLDPHEKAEIDAISKKIDSDCFRCTVRVYAYDYQTAKDLAGVIIQKTSGKWNALEIVDDDCSLRDLAMRREGSRPFLMSSEEIASIWHVPAENTMGDKLHKPLPAALQPPEELLTINVGDPGDIQKLIYSIH